MDMCNWIEKNMDCYYDMPVNYETTRKLNKAIEELYKNVEKSIEYIVVENYNRLDEFAYEVDNELEMYRLYYGIKYKKRNIFKARVLKKDLGNMKIIIKFDVLEVIR